MSGIEIAKVYAISGTVPGLIVLLVFFIKRVIQSWGTNHD